MCLPCDSIAMGVGCECICCNIAGVGVLGVFWVHVWGVISNSDGAAAMLVCVLVA